MDHKYAHRASRGSAEGGHAVPCTCHSTGLVDWSTNRRRSVTYAEDSCTLRAPWTWVYPCPWIGRPVRLGPAAGTAHISIRVMDGWPSCMRDTSGRPDGACGCSLIQRSAASRSRSVATLPFASVIVKASWRLTSRQPCFASRLRAVRMRVSYEVEVSWLMAGSNTPRSRHLPSSGRYFGSQSRHAYARFASARTSPTLAAEGAQAPHRAGVPFQLRTGDAFAGLAFAGLELLPPGLVPVSEGRPDTEPGFLPRPAEVGYYGAIARKPIRPLTTRISSCGR
jgi:hypothetical protein